MLVALVPARGTRRVRLVRGEGRGVSTFERGGGGGGIYQCRSTIFPACDSSFSTRASLTVRTSSCTSKWKSGPDFPRALVSIM